MIPIIPTWWTAFVAQHCFGINDCPPNNTNESNSAEDQDGHGTLVAGIITFSGVVGVEGVAPDAKIVAVRGDDSIGDIVKSLEWIRDQQSTLHVDIINISLGSTTLYPSTCDGIFEKSMTGDIIRQLHNLGIVVFAASGNEASSTAMTAPACNNYVISVGATYDSDIGWDSFPTANCTDFTTSAETITCYTNSNQMLDIVAPGGPIRNAPEIGSGPNSHNENGTSFSTPIAAGVAALLLEAHPGLTYEELNQCSKRPIRQ